MGLLYTAFWKGILLRIVLLVPVFKRLQICALLLCTLCGWPFVPSLR